MAQGPGAPVAGATVPAGVSHLHLGASASPVTEREEVMMARDKMTGEGTGMFESREAPTEDEEAAPQPRGLQGHSKQKGHSAI